MVFQWVGVVDIVVASENFIEHALQCWILRYEGAGVAHVLLRVDGFLHAEGTGFFHHGSVSNVRFGIAHHTAHVLFKADNKERNLVH